MQRIGLGGFFFGKKKAPQSDPLSLKMTGSQTGGQIRHWLEEGVNLSEGSNTGDWQLRTLDVAATRIGFLGNAHRGEIGHATIICNLFIFYVSWLDLQDLLIAKNNLFTSVMLRHPFSGTVTSCPPLVMACCHCDHHPHWLSSGSKVPRIHRRKN